MKIISVVGACPQFIKCAPLYLEQGKEHEEILINTRQQYDHEMSDILFEELDRLLDIGTAARVKFDFLLFNEKTSKQGT
jgi:UDP-N-acetylglucosamine 2-epimerase